MSFIPSGFGFMWLWQFEIEVVMVFILFGEVGVKWKTFPASCNDNVTRQEPRRNPFYVKKMSSRNSHQSNSFIKGKKNAFFYAFSGLLTNFVRP